MKSILKHDYWIDVVCKAYDIDREILLDIQKYKTYRATRPRIVLACFLYNKCWLTYKQIGELMNYKNHTSVYYAIRKSGDKYKDDVIAIERQLEDDKKRNT